MENFIDRPFIGENISEKNLKYINKGLHPHEELLGAFQFEGRHILIFTTEHFINWNRSPIIGRYNRTRYEIIETARINGIHLEIIIKRHKYNYKYFKPNEMESLKKIINLKITQPDQSTNKTMYMGGNITQSHIDKILREFIDSDEKVQGIFKYSRDSLRSHYLIITDKRMIDWNRSFTTGGVDSIVYNRISNISIKQGFLTGNRVIITIDGTLKTFYRLHKESVSVLERMVRENISKYLQQPTTQINPDDFSRSTQDPLQILDTRYASGDISRNEYNQMKNDLIGIDGPKSNQNSLTCSACSQSNPAESEFCTSCGTNLKTSVSIFDKSQLKK